ncbi:MAG: CoA transferase subunit A [Acidimicrobiia bacterium]
MPFHLGTDKLIDLASAARLVSPGSVVALGGGLSARLPMALVRQLIRSGIGGLHAVGSAHSIDVDLLIAAGLLAVSEESYVGFEQDHGLAPAFRRAAESQSLEIRESCCDTMLNQLRAAEMGIPFIPVRGVRGTDIRALHPEYAEVECPFTGETLTVVPAIRPDVALLHAPIGDAAGNLHLEQPYVLDERFAMASAAVIATVDRIVTTEEVASAGITVPGYRVAAIVEAPFGAHPTSCYPGYAYDRTHIAEYVRAAATAEGASTYLARYVLGTDEDEYRRMIGESRLEAITGYHESTDRWMEVFA